MEVFVMSKTGMALFTHLRIPLSVPPRYFPFFLLTVISGRGSSGERTNFDPSGDKAGTFFRAS